MTKIEIEIDLNEKQIEELVSSKISYNISNKIEKDLSSKTLKITTECINKEITKFMKTFWEKEIITTDSWGDVKEKKKVKDIIKNAIDSALKIKVDKEGRVGSSYDCTVTYIEYLIKESVKKYSKELNEHNEKLIKESIQNLLKTNQTYLLTELSKKIISNPDLKDFIVAPEKRLPF